MAPPMNDPREGAVAIVGAVRTPLGKFRGALSRVPAVELGRLAASEVLRRSGIPPPEVGEVLFGCGIQAGLGQNPARQVALRSGIPPHVGCVTINMVCGSGMKALMLGNSVLRAGEQDVVLVGGMESMDLAPHLIPNSRRGIRMGDGLLVDSMMKDSLLDAYDGQPMGMTGEDIARRYQVTRTEADAFALRSHRRASAARDEGIFDEETVPVPAELTGSGEVRRDEGPRPDTSLEKLSRLPPAFHPEGIVTAGNASQISDGAAALVLVSSRYLQRHSLRPLAWIRSTHASGIEPSRVMEAPLRTVREHLARERLTVSDLDLVEHNEAFATASVVIQRELGIPDDRFNVRGGAVALGHPIGCSGARIVVTLVHEMARRQSSRGLATLCMGGGNGTSVLLEREPH
jgi:acetyl-CoA C-acetyltransferase